MLRSTALRITALLCLAAASVIVLNGCAFMSDEDRDFYGKGWVNPKELDQQPHHAIPDPEAPRDATSAPATTTCGTHPSSESDEWTAPPLN